MLIGFTSSEAAGATKAATGNSLKAVLVIDFPLLRFFFLAIIFYLLFSSIFQDYDASRTLERLSVYGVFHRSTDMT